MAGAKTFINANYKPEWAKTTPGGQNFDAGTYSDFSTGGGWAVYDGAGNYMGAVRPNGTLEYSGAGGTEYKDSFLQAAQKEILSGLGGQWDTSWVKGQTVSPATGETVPGTEYSGMNAQQIAAALSKAGYGSKPSSGGGAGSGSSGSTGSSGAAAAGRVWDELTGGSKDYSYSYGAKAPTYAGDVAELPGKFNFDVAAPTYTESGYAGKRDALLAGLETPFGWDAETDPSWQAYQKQYRREGARAAADALGQVAAATGGVPSSYAVTAAQQAGNYYAAQLSDRLPELYQQAYERYLQEYSRKLGLADTYDALEQQEYGKYRDARGDWESDRAFAYGQHADEYARAAAENETAYQRYLDSYNQWLTERNLDYGAWMDARNLERQAEQDALERARYDAEWARLLQQDALERERYDAEWAYQLEQDAYLRTLQEAETAYQKEQDALERQRYDSEWAYQQEQDALERERYDAEWNRLLEQDALERQRYDSEWAYQQEQDAYRRALEEAAAGGNDAGGAVDGGTDVTGGVTAYIPDTATIRNSHDEAGGWVLVPGYGRQTYAELEALVNRGLVREVYDRANNTVTYLKAD